MKNFTHLFGKPKEKTFQERVEEFRLLFKKNKRNISHSQIPYVDVPSGQWKVREVRR